MSATLTPGRLIGSYEIVDQIGVGGMGEVYRAHDRKLGRDVALKILPASVATDPDRVARFEREAWTLAALNHPGIAHIYGFEQSDDISALVMELVDGEDLSDRIRRGAIPIADALPIARQVADALEAAHSQGIIHRDLKPANIKIRPDGTVKVLDFGLAKALDLSSGARTLESGPGLSATMTSPAMTGIGIILGTAAYMSPEQARGLVVDQRADIWAFGVVFYEMLTGRMAFPGATVTDTLARLIERDPDWNALPAATPVSVRTLLRRCLTKDPRQRAPHIGLARLDVDDALSGATDAVSIAVPAPRSAARNGLVLASAVAVVATIAAALGYWWRPESSNDTTPPYRSLIVLDENMNSRPPSLRFAVSPDGRWLAYVGAGGEGAPVRLWIRSLAENTSRELGGTDEASAPFWSPDSRSIAFFAKGRLMRIQVTGELPTPVDLSDETVLALPGSWGDSDTIVFSKERRLWRVPARGGQSAAVTTLDATTETSHGFPWFLPGGRRILFTSFKGLEPVGVFAVDLDTGVRHRVMDGASNVSNVQYAGGSLFFMRGTTLVAQPFDPSTLTLSQTPVVLADRVMSNVVVLRSAAFSVSQTGIAIYWPLLRGNGSRLAWFTRDGQQTNVGDNLASNRSLALSGDGQRAALIPMNQDGQADVWLVDLRRNVRSRVTHEERPATATWSRDGRYLYYSARKGTSVLNIYRKGEFGTGQPELIVDDGLDKWVTDVSADGGVLLYEAERPGQSWDVFAVTLGPTLRTEVVLASPFAERNAVFAPGGEWIAFTSNDSGQAEDVYVARYPSGTSRTQVSASSGRFPRWGVTGGELLFHAANRLVSASLTLGTDRADIGSVTPLFQVAAPEGFTRQFYDIAPDGRILVSVPSADTTGTSRLELLTNWPGLPRR